MLDLAAGTGNLTRALREHFAHVVAVEPDEGMRAQFDGEVLAGIGRGDPARRTASVDAVFVGEAFHWFDARASARRDPAGRRRGLAVSPAAGAMTEQPGLLPPPFLGELDAIWARFHGDRTNERLSRLA